METATYGGSAKEGAEDFLEVVEAELIERKITTERDDFIKVSMYKFKKGLRRQAREWYQRLPASTKRSWPRLGEDFTAKLVGNEHNCQKAIGLIADFHRKDGEPMLESLK